MSASQGFFESDDDYADRIRHEANEHTIEESTGSAPSQGFFEKDDRYHERISQEARESIVEDLTGSAPSRGFLENDDSYRQRLEHEANEAVVEHAMGSAPSQGFVEDDEDYNTRVRQESNEQIIESGTGTSPRQSWLEGDHDYRSRIAHEARELRARDRSEYSTSDHAASSGTSGGSSSGASPIFLILLILAIVVGVFGTSIHREGVRTPLNQSREKGVATSDAERRNDEPISPAPSRRQDHAVEHREVRRQDEPIRPDPLSDPSFWRNKEAVAGSTVSAPWRNTTGETIILILNGVRTPVENGTTVVVSGRVAWNDSQRCKVMQVEGEGFMGRKVYEFPLSPPKDQSAVMGYSAK